MCPNEMRPLTPKQKIFVAEYLVDLNATQAAIRAGYIERTANKVGPRLLVNVGVQSAIQAAMAERTTRTEITADYVLTRLVEIDQMDCLDILSDTGAIKPVSEWPKIWRQFISGFDVSDLFDGAGDERQMVGVLKKIKWPDKVKNLELIGKHVNVQAFREKVEWSGPNGGPIKTESIVTTTTAQEAAKIYQDLMQGG